MAFNFNLTKNKEVQPKLNPDISLTSNEIELILKLLAQTSFPVKDIEVLYLTLFKLQKLYEQSKT